MNFFNLALGFARLAAEADTSGLNSLANDIFKYASIILVPVMIIVAAGGIFYSIYLGVNLAKADSADKRTEAKSRMINAIIGFVCIFVLVLLMWLFCQYANQIFGWVKPSSS